MEHTPEKQYESQSSSSAHKINGHSSNLTFEEFVAILDSCTDAVVVSDHVGKILYTNEQVKNFFQYEAHELKGQNVRLLTPNEHTQGHDQYMRNYVETRKAKVIGKGRELNGKRKDGSLMPIFLTISETQINDKTLFTAFIKDDREKRELKEENRQQLEEVQASEEELRQNMEELQTTQELMRQKEVELSGQLDAINRTLATIEFDVNGNILRANDQFLTVMGYQLEEVKGLHHRMFVDKQEANSAEYQRFWEELASGKAQSAEFKRIHKDHSLVWLQATYTPVLDEFGKVFKVIKLAQDITRQKVKNLDQLSKLDAIDKSNAVVEFDMNGNIMDANSIFLDLLGYTLEEVKGRHHSVFVNGQERNSEEYVKFWNELNLGNYQTGEFRRVHKNGEEVWIRGSYNPILNLRGKAYKVVKYAQDITAQKLLEIQSSQQLEEVQASEEELRQNMEELHTTQELMRQKEVELSGQLEAIDRTLATVEFDLQGHIKGANAQFLKLMGYTIEEVIGQHHRLFVEEKEANSHEYQKFWEDLRQGIPISDEFQRINKQKKSIWLQATYSPVKNDQGQIFKIIKLAQDITHTKQQTLDWRSQLEAIGKSSAVVEFDMNGVILEANPIFLDLMDYSLEEIKGRHHSLFLNYEERNSDEYIRFWNELSLGKAQTGEFKRLSKSGKEVWINGTYNPILDLKGQPYKVVKYAQDIRKQKALESQIAQQLEETRAQEEEIRQNMEELQATQEKQEQLTKELKVSEAEMQGQLGAINKAYAFVELSVDGNLLNANDNFIFMMGHSELKDIQGKHHREFVSEEYSKNFEYRQFWQELKSGKTISGTFQRISKEGDEVWLDAVYAPVKDDNGRVIKIIKLAKNVTDFTLAFKTLGKFLEELKKGNFEVEFDLGGRSVSGDLAQMIQDNIALRDTLKKIVSEVNRVVNLAGKEGILAERLRMDVQEGAWKNMVDSLNTLLESIYAPLMQINQIITNLSLGDITQRFDMEAEGDIRDMGNALNIALNNLNELIKNIEQNAFRVSDSGKLMIEKSLAARSITRNTSEAIQDMALGAKEQAVKTDDSAKLVNTTLSAAQEVSKKAEIINISAGKGKENCQSGLNIMDSMVENMGDISQSAEVTAQAIEILTNRSEEISRILNVITEIAFQTKLLSVNAQIEAARAGEAGRGFEVVADEIGKLAEDSRSSTVDIDKVIKDVQKDILKTGEAISKMKFSVDSGQKATEKASTVFQEINTSSKETFELSKSILSASQAQKESINSVVDNFKEIVKVSEQSASASQELSLASKEMESSMEQIKGSSENLNKVSDELKNKVSQFKLNRS